MTASETPERAVDALTAGLMPVVIHRLNNATQLLANFQALMQLGGADDLLRDRADDLAETAQTVHELGFVLAVLATASGSSMLGERRERRGVAWMHAAVREGLRRDGRELAEPSAPLPDLAPAVGDGWLVPWAFGTAWYAAGIAAPAGDALAWDLVEADGARVLRLRGVDADVLEPAIASIRDRAPQVEVATEDGACVAFRFPASCFADGAA